MQSDKTNNQQAPRTNSDAASFRVCTVDGIPIRIHLTFLLLLAWIGTSPPAPNTSSLGPLTFICLVFVCVLLHELSHAVVAKRFGIRTVNITLYPIGGVAVLETHPEPAKELWISLAGPSANLAIAGIIAIVLKAMHSSVGIMHLGATHGGVLPDLLWANLILGLFNLIPAFPMDGGRVMRALIARFTDVATATDISAKVGQMLAICCGIFAISRGDFMLILVALFVYIGAGHEASAFRLRALLTGHTVREAMQTEFKTLVTGCTLKDASQVLLAGGQNDFPVMNGSEVVGLLTRDALLRGITTMDDYAYVAGVMQRDFARTFADDDIEAVVENAARVGTIVVFEPDPIGEDRLVGLLTQENALEFLMLAQARRRRQPQS